MHDDRAGHLYPLRRQPSLYGAASQTKAIRAPRVAQDARDGDDAPAVFAHLGQHACASRCGPWTSTSNCSRTSSQELLWPPDTGVVHHDVERPAPRDVVIDSLDLLAVSYIEFETATALGDIRGNSVRTSVA